MIVGLYVYFHKLKGLKGDTDRVKVDTCLSWSSYSSFYILRQNKKILRHVLIIESFFDRSFHWPCFRHPLVNHL